MVAKRNIRREDHATIGRYELDAGKAGQPVIISYTRPRAHIIYVTHVRRPETKAGEDAVRALAARLVEDAQANGDRVVLTTSAVAGLFETLPGWGDTVVAA